MHGRFPLRRPGDGDGDGIPFSLPLKETLPLGVKDETSTLHRDGKTEAAVPVVIIAAELTRGDSTPDDVSVFDDAAWKVGDGADLALSSSRSGVGGIGSVTTWAYLAEAERKRRGRSSAITATMQRLELRPTLAAGSNDNSNDNASSSFLDDRVRDGEIIVGIHGSNSTTTNTNDRGLETFSYTGEAAAATAFSSGSLPEDFGVVVECSEAGEVATEDSSILKNITWKWHGKLPPLERKRGSVARLEGHDVDAGNDSDGGGGGGSLAVVRVLGCSGENGKERGGGRVEIATGVVPWPSLSCSRRQHVNVRLVSPQGVEVGSCRVYLCLSTVRGGDSDDDDDSHAVGAAAAARGSEDSDDDGGGDYAGDGFEEEGKEERGEGASRKEVSWQQIGPTGDTMGNSKADAKTNYGIDDNLHDNIDNINYSINDKGVQAEEPALRGVGLESERDARVPRSYRLSINLASVKDLDNAAYVVSAIKQLP